MKWLYTNNLYIFFSCIGLKSVLLFEKYQVYPHSSLFALFVI